MSALRFNATPAMMGALTFFSAPTLGDRPLDDLEAVQDLSWADAKPLHPTKGNSCSMQNDYSAIKATVDLMASALFVYCSFYPDLYRTEILLYQIKVVVTQSLHVYYFDVHGYETWLSKHNPWQSAVARKEKRKTVSFPCKQNALLS